MVFLPVLLIGLLLWIAIASGFMPSPFCRVLIRIGQGAVRLQKGSLSPRAKEHLADVVRESHLLKGFITISTGDRVTFSHQIPATIRQRLRNILLN